MKGITRTALLAIPCLLIALSGGPAAPADGRLASRSSRFLPPPAPVDPRGLAGKPQARSQPKSKAPRERIDAKKSTDLRRRAREAIAAGDLKTARQLLDAASGVTASSEKQAWCLIEAEYQLAKKRFAKAGLAAMRVVVAHPDSPLVGEALYWTARAYEGLGRPGKAAELYRECASRPQTAARIRKLAQGRLDEVEKKAAE